MGDINGERWCETCKAWHGTIFAHDGNPGAPPEERKPDENTIYRNPVGQTFRRIPVKEPDAEE